MNPDEEYEASIRRIAEDALFFERKPVTEEAVAARMAEMRAATDAVEAERLHGSASGPFVGIRNAAPTPLERARPKWRMR